MGMLGRIANAVGTAAETIGTMKLKQISEEELLDKKAALEEAREQRILEAQAKAEERANLEWSRRNEIDQGFKMTENQYRINQENERFDKETERQKGMLTLGHQLGRDDADYKNKLENDPNDIDYQVKASQLGAHELQKEKARLELDNEKQTLALKDKILNGSPEEQAEAINKINMLSGKEKAIIKTAKVQFGTTEDGKPIMGDALYREDPNGKVQWVNPQDELRKLNPTMGMSDADVEALATEMTDKQIGARNSTSMFIPNDGVDNTKEYDDALAANKVKVKSGMLNSGKDIPSNMKTGDDVKDTTLRVIMLNESSGNPTAQNRDKPGNTAGGLFQLTDATAKELGAVVGKDGKISYEEKNRMAKIFYDTAYRKYGDDVPKILGAGFAPNGVAEAVKKAEIAAQKDPSIDPSTDWIQFGGESIQNNKAEIIDRTRQVIGELAKKDIEIPISLSRFYNRNRKRA